MHLGKRQYGSYEREKDFYNAFNESVEIALREKVDAFVVSGDLFDTPVPYHGMEPIEVALRGFRKLKEAGIEVIVIPGDHDAPKKVGKPSILFVREFGGAKVLVGEDAIRGIEVKGVKFYGIPAFNPYRSSEREQVKKLMKILAKKADKKSVLVMHVGICDILPFSCIEMEELPKGFGYYAMGHVHKSYHKYYSGSPLVYPGSLEVVSKDEIVDINNKGPVLVDASDDFSFQKIRIKVRPQFIVFVRGSGLKALSEVDKQIAQIPPRSVIHLEVSEEAKPFLEAIVRKVKEKRDPLILRINVITKKKKVDEPKKSVPKGVGILEALKEIYGEKLGERIYKLVEAGMVSKDEAYKELIELFESGLWSRARRAS
ncbi:hypothetical protein IPA_05965 [Ignicoccus pacificus DSM 13166]|uniref:Calcineurin-like phosphoesterase domain-containing protein n=1 Tax=Ignicoccus pacificus DSM 13166 TaxID=940294 RepID=A0A977KBC3_9CREN|nr:hypothetical protein IPA_05965 [Ignicoccus pacificus DSM 13166]